MSDLILSRSWCKAVGKSSIVVFVRVFWRFGDRIRVGRHSYSVVVRSSLSGREFTVLIWKFGGNYYASYYGVVLSACYCHRMSVAYYSSYGKAVHGPYDCIVELI